MPIVRRALVLVSFSMACRSQPDPNAATAMPLPSVSASPATTTSAPAPSPPKRICEATITCGKWSRCTWLELDHVEPSYEVFRIAGSDAGGYGSHYWRWHQCWPEDAGRDGCAIYCDRAGVCVDALSSDSICTVSGPPRPSRYVCEVRGTECVTLP